MSEGTWGIVGVIVMTLFLAGCVLIGVFVLPY